MAPPGQRCAPSQSAQAAASRCPLDAPPATGEPGQLSRPRLKGDRRPTLEALLADEETMWSQLTIEQWYGDAPREAEVATDSAVWYRSGKPHMLLR